MNRFQTESGKRINNGVEGLTKGIYWLVQLVAIISMILLCGFGFLTLFKALFHFDVEKVYDFLKEILHSLEIMFVAPIPVLIAYSFRHYISAMFMENENEETEDQPAEEESQQGNYLHRAKERLDGVINALEAKKAFTTSLIGITSTYLLGLFIELFSPEHGGDATKSSNIGLTLTLDYIIIVGFTMAFLIIQIILYNILSKKH